MNDPHDRSQNDGEACFHNQYTIRLVLRKAAKLKNYSSRPPPVLMALTATIPRAHFQRGKIILKKYVCPIRGTELDKNCPRWLVL